MFKNCTLILATSLLFACGGGGGSENKTTTPPVVTPPAPSFSISGAGIKGPLSNAEVKLYSFENTSPQTKGALVAQGTTNSKAEITNLSLSGEPEGYYVLEFSAVADTLDISTQAAPIIKRFRTLVSAEQITAGDPIYASPLSSLTLAIAQREMSNGVAITEALANAEHQAKAYFGLGLESETQLLNGSAMLSGAGESVEQQLKALELRRAIEAFSIVLSQILDSIQETEFSEDELIDQIALDLADGVLDAADSKESEFSYGIEHVHLFKPSVNIFELPNSNGLQLFELAQVMVDETSFTLESAIDATDFLNHAPFSTHNHFALRADLDGDGIDNLIDDDDDNDSVLDKDDAMPFDDSEHLDTDLDGIGNNTDNDDDGDGVVDEEDLFPLDSLESTDFDGDGVGDYADLDDDNDSVLDSDDAFPFDSSETKDTDLDGIGNNTDTDDDNDGFIDQDDAFPLDKMEWVDTDADGIGNNTDSDDDNDGVYDNDDELPLDSTESVDFDKDGIGDIADNDDDNDNIADAQDNIHVSPLANNDVSVDEELTFYVRGFYENGTVLDGTDGWHVQYYITDLSNGKQVSFYTDNGYYNASFISGKKEWQIAFPSPSYSGDFQIRFSLYCSKGEGACSPNTDPNKHHQWEQVVNFSVICEATPCGYQPEPEPGKNISASVHRNYPVSSVLQKNGNILLTYMDFEENNWKTHVSVSTNKGYTWSKISKLPSPVLQGKLIERQANNTLLNIYDCYGKICLNESDDAKTWSKTELASITRSFDCSGVNCDLNHIRINSAVETEDGAILIYFQHQPVATELNYKTYVSKSYDLNLWSEPTPVFDSLSTKIDDVIRLDDGRYIALLWSNTSNNYKTHVMVSEDGEEWSEVYVRSPLQSPKITYSDGVFSIFYQDWSSINEIRSTDLVEYSAPRKVVDKMNERFELISYGNNKFGLIYGLELNFQYDVFYEDVELD